MSIVICFEILIGFILFFELHIFVCFECKVLTEHRLKVDKQLFEDRLNDKGIDMRISIGRLTHFSMHMRPEI